MVRHLSVLIECDMRAFVERRENPMIHDKEERDRIQKKQGGHHYPPRPEDGPPMDDTDRSTDKIIKPSRQPSSNK
jgi:hypothetical protein